MTVSMKYNDECVTAINANCSEDKIKTILTFIDYFYSEEWRDPRQLRCQRAKA